MEPKEWLDKVAYIGEMDTGFGLDNVYLSNFDDSYIAHVGMEESIRYLAEREITDELQHGVGFSPKTGKWYGWSHRAICGFEIGSECKKGHCHYVAATPEDMIDDYANFFADISEECAKQRRAECQILEDRSGIRILQTPIKLPVIKDISDLEDGLDNPGSLPEELLFENDMQVIKCGRGEWVAKTLEDAKQMAIDFNKSVS
ncbi:MAG: hypothetical protein N0C84_05770 [Candidatus Thiodiazotropha taylori]|uniref:Uncharacterized protein n=1 Tax=Candidatus Thiodiazotropha taylori TaxID=2792791 RepID=A0A9E4KB41_9GAMM|nr:hypothetical protein [Candidatus Thiodiazotropha taylori]MCW4255961.1 hypothetical protein [Candidatus Thiodiazotropha taylori]